MAQHDQLPVMTAARQLLDIIEAEKKLSCPTIGGLGKGQASVPIITAGSPWFKLMHSHVIPLL